MDITILQMDERTLEQVDKCGEPFTVDSRLALRAKDGKIEHEIVPVAPYEKQYPPDTADYSAYINDENKAIFLAYAGDELAGQLRILKHWNAYAYVDDIAIKARFRGQGVGRVLIQHAIEWARGRGFPGLMLETQDVNVAACCLYESCGFELGGFDRYLYKGLHPGTEEVALYWYFIL